MPVEKLIKRLFKLLRLLSVKLDIVIEIPGNKSVEPIVKKLRACAGREKKKDNKQRSAKEF